MILAGYDFPGNFRAIESVGARAVLVDVRQHRWTMDIELIESACSPATNAVIVSHLHGQNTPMSKLIDLAKRLNLVVIEDCCQAPGAVIDGKPAGSWGDCSSLSFGGSKLLTSGRGGAVLCRDPRVAQRITNFCERGNDAFALSQLQAAAVLPQISELEGMNLKRQDIVVQLAERFDGRYQWLNCIDNQSTAGSVFYKWPLLLENFIDVEGHSGFRESVIQCLNERGIEAGAGFNGFHRRVPKRARAGSSLEHSVEAVEQTVLIQHHALFLKDIVQKLEVAFAEIDKQWNERFSSKR